ncbi:divergent polysaccharide deacetylase family protein [Hasllibacter sp. MH4015]|uniref:divergent polysaccharide deacetylase family protein n=1 Tax=Hasllibacter sp. MH4015 TaxID=2854029 RepID=UPI001CD30CD3|nr:divergent polysaccharide deacetylase family protein [Hasllibacter sp. MH4015]
MGGLSVGVFWGLIVSAIGLAAVSLSVPLPPRDGTAAVEVAAEAAEDSAPAEVDAVAEEALAPLPAPAPEAPVEEATVGDAPAAEAEPPAEDAAPAAPAEDAAPDAEEVPAEEQDATRPATEVPLPSGSEFNRPPPEEEAVLPAPDAAPSTNAPAPLVVADVEAPTLDVAPAAQPDVSVDAPAAPVVAALGAAPEQPSANARPSVAAEPTTLSQPVASANPDVDTATAALPEPEAAPEPAPVVAPEEDVAEAAGVGEDAAPESDPAPDPTPDPAPEAIAETPQIAPSLPTISAPPAAPALGEETAGLATPVFPQTSGLPQVTPGAGEVDVPAFPQAPETEGDLAEVAVEADPDATLPAIEAFAAPFDTSEERPLLAVVLIDDPESRIELATLTRFTFPVAFAVDPLHPDAQIRAQTYREAGFEVVILGSMVPEGATPADLEVALSSALLILPEAVAVMDTPGGRIQSDRPILDATVAALGETGHGLLAFPRGLNAAEQSASRADVPAATLFRLLDDEDQRATVITRYLARAAFTASQEGAVIVAGYTRPDTVTALFSWALGGRSEAVAIAPVSAVIQRASAP